MDQELQELGERVERMLSLSRRLADENATLRDQLAAAKVANEQLQQRIAEARARVEAALSRLPAPPAATAGSDTAAP
ncbi:DUF904 domain-containing protein [Burkholderiaceae bacterium FT117]|uniref:DUF904 domain-containing protein n=1 Tax=Zeimonas sediminis TaxID=2944268 RepID=UPI002342DD90|nr:DUF904 domain-containing protein [Zeimonas sediminis]MCM5572208.1 DUF904 domain-containing protein [Zeimonas sediminis]